MKKNKAAVTATTFLVSIALMFSTAATASANPIYDYALHVLNSRVECEQTLKESDTPSDGDTALRCLLASHIC